MKEWYSISELLAAGLTNFPSSDKGITKKANRENWRKRQRKGVKGKTFEYHVSSMPSFVQEALCGKLIEPKEWFTAFELVGVGGLPTLPSNVTQLATKNGWLSRQVKGKRGVAFEYHYSALPFEVQQALSFIGTSKIHAHCECNSEKEWFSANELVGLRGLPTTPQGINKKARTQHWEKRSKNGVQGLAIEYHYSSLPEDVQQELSFKFRLPESPSKIRDNFIGTKLNGRNKDELMQAIKLIEDALLNIGNKKPEESFNNIEHHLVQCFRKASEEGRVAILTTAESMASLQEKKEEAKSFKDK